MVSVAIIAILILLIGGVVTSLFITLPEPEYTPPRKVSFLSFSLEQDGTNIIIRNTGAEIIFAKSLKVYLNNKLTDLTNPNNIPSASVYKIKLAELPKFEGKANLTVVLNDISESIEILSIVENVKPISEIFPPVSQGPSAPTTPTVKIYGLDVSISGGGTVTVEPPGYDYEEGTEVQVNATPDINHTFGFWILDGVEFSNASLIIAMNKNHSLRAAFLIRSDVDCARANPGLVITNKTPQSNISMTFLANVTNRDYKCSTESFELLHSCPSEFNCNVQTRLISIQSGNSSETIDFFMSPKNVTALATGNYTFSITVKNRADTRYSSANSSFYEIK